MAYADKYVNPTGAGLHDGSTPADAWSLTEALAGQAAGQRINVLAGAGNTYDAGATNRTFSVSGTVTAPLWWRGYKATPGDLDALPTAVAGTDMPSFVSSTGVNNVTGSNQIFSSLDFSSAAASATVQPATNNRYLFYGCRFSNTNSASAARAVTVNSGNTHQFVRCLFSTANVAGSILSLGAGDAVLGCRFSGPSLAINALAFTGTLIGHNIFDATGQDGIQTSTGSCLVWGNSFYGLVGHGFNMTGTPATSLATVLLNNHFENLNGASKFCITNSSGTNTNGIIAIGNTNYNCTGVYNGLGDMPPVYDGGTLTGSGFVDAPGHDFTPSALLRAKGFPSLFEGTGLPGYMTPGAIQAAASGGGFVRLPTMRTRGG